MKNPINNPPLFQTLPGSAQLKAFFISHLNRIYYAKTHLAEILPELAVQAHFGDLKHAVNETLEDVEKQIVRMDEIYILLDTLYSFENCNGLIGLVEEAYDFIQQQDDWEMRDLAILIYLQHIESIEMSSFKALQLIAIKFKNKQIIQLLLENFDEAKEDRALLIYITKKHLAG